MDGKGKLIPREGGINREGPEMNAPLDIHHRRKAMLGEQEAGLIATSPMMTEHHVGKASVQFREAKREQRERNMNGA